MGIYHKNHAVKLKSKQTISLKLFLSSKEVKFVFKLQLTMSAPEEPQQVDQEDQGKASLLSRHQYSTLCPGSLKQSEVKKTYFQLDLNPDIDIFDEVTIVTNHSPDAKDISSPHPMVRIG